MLNVYVHTAVSHWGVNECVRGQRPCDEDRQRERAGVKGQIRGQEHNKKKVVVSHLWCQTDETWS